MFPNILTYVIRYQTKAHLNIKSPSPVILKSHVQSTSPVELAESPDSCPHAPQILIQLIQEAAFPVDTLRIGHPVDTLRYLWTTTEKSLPVSYAIAMEPILKITHINSLHGTHFENHTYQLTHSFYTG